MLNRTRYILHAKFWLLAASSRGDEKVSCAVARAFVNTFTHLLLSFRLICADIQSGLGFFCRDSRALFSLMFHMARKPVGNLNAF